MTTKEEKIAFVVIAACLLITGWLDGQDAKMAERYAVAQTGQQIACSDCAGGVR
ncbi:MAG: hypothetical protein RL661_199 [Pseudomonadota bacterium]|jgi:hypothetical protein